jgi:hypothetical protein
MAGIGAIIGGVGALASAGAGIAGAAKGGNGSTKSDRMWNDWQRLQTMNLFGKQNKLLKDANNVYKNPAAWQPYSGQRVADLTPDQQTAFNLVRQQANGSPQISQANNMVSSTLNGDYLNNLPNANPFLNAAPSTSNGFIGGQPNVKNQYIGAFANYTNPWEGQQPDTQNFYEGLTTDKVYNPMLGMDNPYLTGAIDNAAQDTIRNYKKAVAPSTDASFARAGAFGGSAWGEQTAENERNLAKVLVDQATKARMDDYQTQQGLQNQNAQFYTGVNQSDLTRNAGLDQSRLGLDQNAWQTNAGINQNAENTNQNTWQTNLQGTQAQNELESLNWSRNLDATQAQNSLANNQWATQAGLYNQNYNNERDRQMDATGRAISLGDYGTRTANNLLNIGGVQQNQNQNLLGAAMDLYGERQNAYRAPIDWMMGKYQGVMGGLNPSGTTPQSPSTNPIAAGIGGAIGGWQLGNGIYNAGKDNGWWGTTKPMVMGGWGDSVGGGSGGSGNPYVPGRTS